MVLLARGRARRRGGGRAEQEAKRAPTKNGGRGKITQAASECLIIHGRLCFAGQRARDA